MWICAIHFIFCVPTLAQLIYHWRGVKLAACKLTGRSFALLQASPTPSKYCGWLFGTYERFSRMQGNPESQQPPPLLISIQYFACSVPCLSSLTHVLDRINELLDYRVLMDIPRACGLRNVPFLRYLARREDLCPTNSIEDEPLIRASRFSLGSVIAARHGHLGVIQWLVSEYDTETALGGAIEEAAKFGHLNIIQWLYDHCHSRTLWNGLELVNAVANNHLETAQWLYEHVRPKWLQPPKGVRENRETNMTQWLNAIEVGFAASNAIATRDERRLLDALQLVAQQWDFSFIKWVVSNHTTATDSKASTGRRRALERIGVKELKATRPKRAIWTATAMDTAAASGHLSIIEWLHSHRSVVCSTSTIDAGASNGHLRVVKWLHANLSEGFTTQAMDGAAKNNHMEVVRWLHEHRTEGCTPSAMDYAAGNGHLKMVQWLHQHRSEGCTTRAMDEAAAGGHFDVVKWLHHNRTEGCTVAAMDEAAKGCHFSVLKWIHEHRSEGCSKSAIDNAAGSGRLDIIRWLETECSAKCTHQAVLNAAANGHLETILYLSSKMMAGVTSAVPVNAASGGHVEVLRWYINQYRGYVSPNRVWDAARKNNRFHCLCWLKSEGIVPYPQWFCCIPPQIR